MIDTMTREKDVFLDSDDFASYLIEQLQQSEFAHNNSSLQRELATAKIESDKIQKYLIAYNDKRFNLMREYLNAESDNNAELQNIVDLFSQEIVGEPRQLIADISDRLTRSTRLLVDLDRYQSTESAPKIEMKQEKSLAEASLSLNSKLSRIMAATTTG